MLTKQDKKYINDVIVAHTSHYMTALKEGFQDQVKMLAELIQDRPTRNEAREMIKEEVEPFRQDLIHHILAKQ